VGAGVKCGVQEFRKGKTKVKNRTETSPLARKNNTDRGGHDVSNLCNLHDVRKAGLVHIIRRKEDADALTAALDLKSCKTSKGRSMAATAIADWHQSYGEVFKDKTVRVYPCGDSDAEWAHAVLDSIQGCASQVKLIRLPGLHQAGQVSRWLTERTPKELRALIRKTAAWQLATMDTISAEVPDDDFEPTSLGVLLSQPPVPVDWVVQGLLQAGTVSMLTAKPKVGKSTLARNLALAVARGEEFLGRHVKRGEVVYLALEERRDDLVDSFRAMGAKGDEAISITDVADFDKAITLVRRDRPRLVVIDPIILLLKLRNVYDYAKTYAELGPLIRVARQTGTHILCLHHSSKLNKHEAIDSPIGSVAFGGLPSTVLTMRVARTYRTLQSVQRIGENLEETVLEFAADSQRIRLGAALGETEIAEMEGHMLDRLADHSLTQPEIEAAVVGRTTRKRHALRELKRTGKIILEGRGRRGDPYRYRKACSDVPGRGKKRRNKKSSVIGHSVLKG
jgi:hypothetical protein